MLKTGSFIFAVAVVVLYAVAPAVAEDQRYVGITFETFAADQGYFAPHRACWDRFGGVWCTSKMIVEDGPHPLAASPPASGAWINPVISGGVYMPDTEPSAKTMVIDMTGASHFIQNGRLNCNRWRSTAPNFFGLTLEGSGAGPVEIAIGTCAVARPAACCGGNLLIHLPLLIDPPTEPRE